MDNSYFKKLMIDECADYHYSDREQIEIMHKLLKKYYENCSENMLTNILKQLDDISGDKKRLINNRED